MLNIATKELNLHKCKPNCFEKTAVRWDFFYFIAPNVSAMCSLGIKSTALSNYKKVN